eukprot:TRINITY_DN25865_c0_g1_i1.p1 TRINITY_DN25865_c0_g1~~TRINITY_DN25865_c0_g1_i1.p1  ORF type:complete len:126 (+),score=19.41 TRINITY_DN25865_c0_g1_i1:78-455(+)
MIPVNFSYDTYEAKEVLLAGSFNDWNPVPMPRYTRSLFRVILFLNPGVYTYKFIVDGVWVSDTSKPQCDDNCGGCNNVVTVEGIILEVNLDAPSISFEEWQRSEQERRMHELNEESEESEDDTII